MSAKGFGEVRAKENFHRVLLWPLFAPAVRSLAALTPEWLVTRLEHWRTSNPQTLNEKIRYKMARDRRTIVTMFADKYLVRDYVQENVGSHVLTKLYASATRADLIDWSAIPREFVAKVNHGSGGLVVVSNDADPAQRLPTTVENLGWTRFFVHPDSLDPNALLAVLNYWLTLAYGQQKLIAVREWGYANIARRVQVEEYIGSEGTMPRQITVLCIHGRAEEIIYYGGAGHFEQELPARFMREEFDDARGYLQIPLERWTDVLRMCEVLGAPVDMVRVDWMLTPDRFIFNELTNYPAAGKLTLQGNPLYSTAEVNRMLGALWSVPQKY